jgi:Asp-tRNA(Asn)/Glu-tRNA(Gln) amidotransferase C subunit
MSTDLSTADVERVAALAHLELTDAEESALHAPACRHPHYAEQIQSLDTHRRTGDGTRQRRATRT